jgi:uncharacterized protein (DUF58 family)
VPSQATSGRSRFLDPIAVSRLATIDLKAKLVVEGFFAGLHRSPYHGFSVEFAEHRPYMPGDPLRSIDWKVLAKSERLYVKQYEEETNLRAYLLLDVSASMWKAPRHPRATDTLPKLEYASYLAAALAHLMLDQNDAVGLLTFDSGIRRFIPPRSIRRHLAAILATLEEEPSGRETAVAASLNALAERVRRRGLIIVLSDLLDPDVDGVLAALAHFRHRKHEVLVFHVLDSVELAFPFDREARFVDTETGDRVDVQPDLLRRDYLATLDAWRTHLRNECREHRIDYVSLDTRTPFDTALLSYLQKRSRLY